MKQEVIDKIKVDLGQVDLVIYSLVVLCCIDLVIGEVYKFMFKLVGQVYIIKIYDIDKDLVYDVSFEFVNDDEIFNIVKVMGGEDWELWLDVLFEVGVLVEGCKMMVYIYIGKELIWLIYGQVIIGKVKEDLDCVVSVINDKLFVLSVDVYVLLLKVLVM